MNEKKRVFGSVLLGLQNEKVNAHINELTRQLKIKDSKIDELERTIKYLEKERHDLLKQLNLLKEFFREQKELQQGDGSS